MFNQHFEDWNSNSAAATLTCTGSNLTPETPASDVAVVWCIAVP